MFPSRIKPEQPIDPGYVRKRLQQILQRADCKKVRLLALWSQHWV